MSEKTTKGYKISTEAKEWVEQLYANSEFEDQGEFLLHMASLHEMHMLKNGDAAGYQKQIDELEYHSRRTLELFLSMVQSEAAGRVQLGESYEAKLTDRANEIFLQQEEISVLSADLKREVQNGAALGKQLSEQLELIEALRKSDSKNEQILAENKEKIERLTTLVTENMEVVNKAKATEQQLSVLTKTVEDQERQIIESVEAVEALRHLQEERLAQQATRFEEQLASSVKRHAEELQSIKDRADLDQEKAVLSIRREMTDATEKERNLFEKERAEHNAELRKLYQEMDKLRQELVAHQRGKNDPSQK